MHSFPKVGLPVETLAAVNPDGSRVIVLVNANENKRQVRYHDDQGQEWYIELLPDSVSTVVFTD